MITSSTIETALLPPALTAAAQAVANAEAAVTAAKEAFSRASAPYFAARRRIDHLESQRASIAARRKHGDQRDTDAGEVALIDMDAAALEEVAREERPAMDAASAEVKEAERRLALARERMAEVESREDVELLIKHTNMVCGALVKSLDALAAAGKKIGSHNFSWRPPADLTEKLRRAQIAGRPM